MGTNEHRLRVVIIGGGFAGLQAAMALRRADVDLTVIDRRNHHLFQPLLYQVATAALSPAQIAAPIRSILSKHKNTNVILGEVTAIDLARREVTVAAGVGGTPAEAIGYDYLIVATGATHSYFGRDDWAARAPGLKTVEDAIEIRRRFLLAFEVADRMQSEADRRRALTFVVVGGGPTGVEMAGAMSEIARKAIPQDFRSIDTKTARILLVEASERVLATYAPQSSARAKRDLEALGVEVMTHARVTEMDRQGVDITPHDAKPGDKPVRIDAGNIIWAAGVRASHLGGLLTAGMKDGVDKSGRVLVQPDLTLAGHGEVFVVGDLAHVERAEKSKGDEKGKNLVPGIAPAAMQMGWYAGRVVARECAAIARGAPPGRREPFAYLDKGTLATIGRARAVADIRGFRVAGVWAWLLWAFVHIFYLISFRNRLTVVIDWVWAYLAFQRGARLIAGETREKSAAPGRTPNAAV